MEDGGGKGPKLEAVSEEYLRIFGSPSTEDEEAIGDAHPHADDLEVPITIGDVLRTMAKVRSNAVGPDGVKPSDLKKIAPVRIAILFNALLLFGVCPDSLKTNRTILIPKGGDPEEVGNWRPITI